MQWLFLKTDGLRAHRYQNTHDLLRTSLLLSLLLKMCDIFFPLWEQTGDAELLLPLYSVEYEANAQKKVVVLDNMFFCYFPKFKVKVGTLKKKN